MTDFRIELGTAEGAFVLGVQPPIGPEQRLLIGQLSVMEMVDIRHEAVIRLGEDSAYWQIIFSANPDRVVHTGRNLTRILAEDIAESLSTDNGPVVVDHRLHPIGYGVQLFGAKQKMFA